MARKRRTFGAAFMAKVALAAAKGDRTTAHLASEYRIHAGQVTAWMDTGESDALRKLRMSTSSTSRSAA